MNLNSYIIPGSANTTNKCVSWFKFKNKSVVAFASANLVHIFDYNQGNVICSLNAHKSKINAIMIDSQNNEECGLPYIKLYSADDTGNLIVWYCDDLMLLSWEILHNIETSASIISMDIMTIPNKGTFLSVMELDGSSTTWNLKIDSNSPTIVDQFKFPLAQIIRVHCMFPLFLDEDQHLFHFLLAMGSVDSKIYFRLGRYDTSKDFSTCVDVGFVLGHEDWITTLACRKLNETVMLLSGSQDCKMRVWKIKKMVNYNLTENIIKINHKFHNHYFYIYNYIYVFL
jgi:WD40 repeat protein